MLLRRRIRRPKRALLLGKVIIFVVVIFTGASIGIGEYYFGDSNKMIMKIAAIHSCLAFQQQNHQHLNDYHRQISGSMLTSLSLSSSIKLHDSSNFVDDQRKEGSNYLLKTNEEQSKPLSSSFSRSSSSSSFLNERREFLLAIAAMTMVLPLQSESAEAFEVGERISAKKKSLEDLQFASGSWNQDQKNNITQSKAIDIVPAYFITYLTRFLINYDEGVAAWWQQLQQSYSLLSNERRQMRLGRDFGSFSVSLQYALQSYLQNSPTSRQGYQQIFELFVKTYDTNNSSNNKKEVRRHLCLLAAILPVDQQPKDIIQKIISSTSIPTNSKQQQQNTLVDAMTENLSTLLSREYNCIISNSDGSLAIQPSISLYQVGVGEEFGQAATATTFGPLALNALKRELPRYTFDIYALFGISGATGCALTHSVVIPLDVVKTRAQTSPESYSTIVTDIVETEGISGLLVGAQATLAGYAWYGLSVYPSYAFFKRFLGNTVLTADLAAVHANDIALIAGALAAVIASLGLTPLEAARIRVVTDPARYKSLGLIGTLQIIASEGIRGTDNVDNESTALSSLKSLYKGLPSLMTRQVIFGSLKFLVFERACEAIYLVSPMLRDATWTSLSVSLVAGGFSGALSSLVSQPADAVLTYVAQDSSKGLGVLEGSRLMIEESGVSSLFRGLGSRSLWAACIISGQFLLYDVFVRLFGVADLSQIYKVNL